MVLITVAIVLFGTWLGAVGYLMSVSKTCDPIIPVSKIEITKEEAISLVKKRCENEKNDYVYSYNNIKKTDNEWRIPIMNVNCLCYAVVDVKTGEVDCMKEISFSQKKVTITTDKTEYKQGEMVKISVKNNLDNPIKHLKGVECGLQGFSNREWTNALSSSCKWNGEDKLESNSEYNFNWTTLGLELEKYRVAFYYQEQKIIETKEIGKIICEGEGLPNELEKLLLNREWVRSNDRGCASCDACGCSCTAENVWSIDEASIDITYVSCAGNSYIIKYKNKEYICVLENHKSLYGYLSPPENWSVIYSNEFTIKEKSVLDLRCNEKVKGVGYCRGFREGYEFDSETGKCVKKGASGCSFEIPFESLEECQEVCENNKDVCMNEDDECTVRDIDCCDGLKKAPLVYEKENEECGVVLPCGSICIPCGNGICDRRENKCNCPEDCK